jgi:electron transfer flavoprotein alpha subunit
MSTPLRIAALIKQIPVAETLTLGPDGRLARQDLALEMNAYCRRAVSKGVELARASGGTCTVVTLGPPSAEDVLREGLAWGADNALHLCDPAFAGSDTLATSRALVSALERCGPFDLILLGRNTIDGETGQVGPEVAQLLGLPFASGARELEVGDGHLALELETDDGFADVSIDLPAVVSAAERLCEPCKVDPGGRAKVSADRIRVLNAADLGPGPWGDEGSPTRVGAVRTLTHHRQPLLTSGPIEVQVAAAVRELARRGALSAARGSDRDGMATPAHGPLPQAPGALVDGASRPVLIAVVVEHDRLQVGRELVGAASQLSAQIGGTVHALCPDGIAPDALAGAGADKVIELSGSRVAEDVADGLISWIGQNAPWAVLAPSTDFGREVAARAAAATGSGLVGDAIGLELAQGVLVAAKPAFAGALVADITCRSAVQFVTVRPGVLPLPPDVARPAAVEAWHLPPRGRVRVGAERRTDDVETLARADVVIGVGASVQPDDYQLLSPLAAILGAELAATRKVTDKGWAPRARQVGLTGRSIAPRLYVAIGLSGKFNHMVGVRSAGSILAINHDPQALVFEYCDIGIVGDWRQVLPALERSLRHEMVDLRGGAGSG